MDPYLGEIRIIAGALPPENWAICNGALMPISQNQALFSLLGTTYGGDGITTFAVPDLRGRVPMHRGQGMGLSDHRLGERGGANTHTLTLAELPHHVHPMQASRGAATTGVASGAFLAARRIWSNARPSTALAPSSLTAAGGGQAHDNMQPSLALNFVICLYHGLYPVKD